MTKLEWQLKFIRENSHYGIGRENKMTLKEFYKFIEDKPLGDKIVWLKYKYDYEERYDYSCQVLLYEAANGYSWLNDWYEMQDNVVILGYIDVDQIPYELFEEYGYDLRKEKQHDNM